MTRIERLKELSKGDARGMNGPIRRVIYICPYATTQIMGGACPWATSINGMPCGFRSWGCDDLYLCDDEAAQYWAGKAEEREEDPNDRVERPDPAA